MKKNIYIQSTLGVIIICGAFLSVFGSSLKNLFPNDNIVIPADSTTIKSENNNPTTNRNPLPNVSTNDNDDNEYDDDKPVTTKPVQTTPVKPSTPTPTSTGYTMTQVNTHNSATSCWSAINGNVYDLTNWVNSHPGGRAAILMICGKDGTPLFESQHGGERKPVNILAKYLLGKLD